MKTKDFFRMEYAQILIYIVFLGLLEVLLFIFEVNYFLMIYLLLIGLILEGVYLCQRYMKKYRYYKKVKSKIGYTGTKMHDNRNVRIARFCRRRVSI